MRICAYARAFFLRDRLLRMRELSYISTSVLVSPLGQKMMYSSQSLLDGSVATCGVCICIASFHNILDIASILASNVFMCIHVKFLHVCLV